MRRFAITAATLLAGAAAANAAPSLPGLPERAPTDPKSITSPPGDSLAPLDTGDLLDIRGSYGAAWVPDGSAVIASLNLTGRYNLWTVPTAAGFPQQLTRSDEAQGGVAVAPDGKSVVYQQDTGGDEVFDLFSVPLTGGPVAALTRTPDTIEAGAVFDATSTRIAFGHRPKTQPMTNVALLDRASGAVRVLTIEREPGWRWAPVAFVPDGSAIIANRSNADTTDVSTWRIDIASGQATPIAAAHSGRFAQARALSPDGRLLALNVEDGNGVRQAALHDLATGRTRILLPELWEQHVGSFSPDGARVAIMANRDGRVQTLTQEVATGTTTALAMPPGVTFENGSPSGFSPDSRTLLVSHTSVNRPSDFWLAEVRGAAPRQLTRLNLATLTPARLPSTRIVHYPSSDGLIISAVLSVPSGLARNASAPAVVLVHGGPDAQSVDSFDPLAAALASRGFLVIQPNYRGSTGYGRAFLKANRRDLGGGDFDDVIAAARFLVDTGYVDARRIGITGGSYGGYMTTLALGKAPGVFRAGVTAAGIVNWFTMFEKQDVQMQHFQRQLMGDPVTDRAGYIASSPLTYLDSILSPLLVIHGKRDPIVPIGEAEQVVARLKARGVTVDALYFDNEGHGVSRRENAAAAFLRTLAWFDTHLGAPTR